MPLTIFTKKDPPYVMRCTIWYHWYNLKNVKNTYGGVLILVKLQSSSLQFCKINSPPWVFFTFFKLYKWYQIVQRTTYMFGTTLPFVESKFSPNHNACRISMTPRQFTRHCNFEKISNPQIAGLVCLTILWGWHLKG